MFLCLSLPFSAGAGRTGVIIAIHAMMELAEEKAQVDIYNFVFSMRNSRPNIVQTCVSNLLCIEIPCTILSPISLCVTATVTFHYGVKFWGKLTFSAANPKRHE